MDATVHGVAAAIAERGVRGEVGLPYIDTIHRRYLPKGEVARDGTESKRAPNLKNHFVDVPLSPNALLIGYVAEQLDRHKAITLNEFYVHHSITSSSRYDGDGLSSRT